MRDLGATAASFLRSALVLEGPVQSLDDFHAWLASRRRQDHFAVRQVPFAELEQWAFGGDPLRLAHDSGRFFSVDGLRVSTNYGAVPEWDQPIINQPEIGILGMLTRVVDGVRHFLVQAKAEPGNINHLQISPSVQATRSNYTRAHGGATPRYLEYFIEPGASEVLVDQLQSEQGARFFRKRNRNMVVEVAREVPPHEDFCWLTLGQIKCLLAADDLVNMDARSVLSCIPYAGGEPGAASPGNALAHASLGDYGAALLASLRCTTPRHSEAELLSWRAEMKRRYWLRVERRPLDQLRNWHCGDQAIRHTQERYFSVIGVSVEAGSREVHRWSQPILEHSGVGLVGLLTQRIDGVLHCLVRACAEPGSLDTIDLGPTLACSGTEWRQQERDTPEFFHLFREPPADQLRYSAVQSEEGGRFYHFQNRYIVLELPEGEALSAPANFRWMTLAQVADFVARGFFNIEARNLFACLNLVDAA